MTFKLHRFTIGLILVSSVMLLGIVAGGGYFLGLQHQKQTIKLLEGHQAIRENEYAKSLATVRAESDRTFSDYKSSCFEFKRLYEAYKDLRSNAGSEVRSEQYTAPDSARGNETSCYR